MVRKEKCVFFQELFFRTDHKFLAPKARGMDVYNTWVSVFDLNKEGGLVGRVVV